MEIKVIEVRDVMSKQASDTSQKTKMCQKCDEKALIVSYGMFLCAKHGLEHLKGVKFEKFYF